MKTLGAIMTSSKEVEEFEAQWSERFRTLTSKGTLEFPVRVSFIRGTSSLVKAGLSSWRRRESVDPDSRKAIREGFSKLVDDFESHMSSLEKKRYEKAGADAHYVFFQLTRREKELFESFCLFLLSRFLRDEHEFLRHKLYEPAESTSPGEAP